MKHPANLFVAGFIGSPPMNFLQVEKIDNSQAILAGGEKIPLAKTAPKSFTGAKLGVRPNGWQLVSAKSKNRKPVR